jgi:hypothetical protein
VRTKIQEANEFNAKLGLRSKFRLVPARRIGPEESVGVEVSSNERNGEDIGRTPPCS